MKAMASKLLSSLKSHPFIFASSVLLLFALPILRMLIFFWPLIVSTVLGVLAVVSFGRTADEPVQDVLLHEPESASQTDSAAAFSSSQEGMIGNVLMVGNREVTWLEWLHNEDTQKHCMHEREPAVWDGDVDGCDSSPKQCEATRNVAPLSRVSTDVSSGKLHDGLDDAPLLPAAGRGNISSIWSLPGDGEQLAPVLTEEAETTDAAPPPSTVLDGIKATEFAPPLRFKDLNKETTTMQESIARDETNPGESGQVHAMETLSAVNTAVSHTTELITSMLEHEALGMTLPNENVSPFPQMDTDVCNMQDSAVERNDEEKVPNQLAPQWDVSDGEEDGSGLCFSFFHNSSHPIQILK